MFVAANIEKVIFSCLAFKLSKKSLSDSQKKPHVEVYLQRNRNKDTKSNRLSQHHDKLEIPTKREFMMIDCLLLFLVCHVVIFLFALEIASTLGKFLIVRQRVERKFSL